VIKCVVWDLDNTLLDGVFLESRGRPPAANPVLREVLSVLAGRGILHAIASKNPPEAGVHAERVTGHAFAAVHCGWDAKPAAITAIMAELGVTADAVAFVDDDALERAQVSYALPAVLVLGPQDMAGAAGWPEFRPPVVTPEARRRGELYQQRRVRQEEARAFGGSRDEFLRYCQTEVTITAAAHAEVPRLHELSVRTHQFNSAGASWSQAAFREILESPGYRTISVRLRDRYGDDGIVGGCVISAGPAGWEVPLLMLSCRAMGRGVVEAVLGWVCRAARDAGAGEVIVPCVINSRNVPLRVALTGAGFRAPARAGERARYSRRVDAEPLPGPPDWVVAP
jgi:methoxymalonate biosynthesis protein